jgi:DUF1680 family protein
MGEVKLVQETGYPEEDTARLTVTAKQPSAFALRFRVPAWTRGASVAVNGAALDVACPPGSWASVARTWSPGDVVEVRIPLTLRMEPVDAQHPDRVAVVRGPTVLALEGAYHDPRFRLPETDAELEKWLVAEPWSRPSGVHATDARTGEGTIWRVSPPDGSPVRLRFRPFYELPENYPYFLYFDRRALPWRLW